MTTMTRTIAAHYDGRCFVPDEPVDLAPDTRVRIVVDRDAEVTWLEKHHGIRLHVREGAPLASDLIIEDRGPAGLLRGAL